MNLSGSRTGERDESLRVKERRMYGFLLLYVLLFSIPLNSATGGAKGVMCNEAYHQETAKHGRKG